MTRVIANMSMSLDGFIADENDALHIDLVPVLLGRGIRFFDRLSVAPVRLSDPVITPGTGVTHLSYQVKR